MLKKIFLSVLFLIWIIAWYSFVSWWDLVSNSNIKLVSKMSPNIFLDSAKLNGTVLIYKSESSLQEYKLHSTCSIKSSYINNYNNLYFFRVKYLDDNCSNWNLTLKLGSTIVSSVNTKLNLLKKWELFNILVDYNSDELEMTSEMYKKEIKELSIYKDYNGRNIWKYYNFLKKQRKYYENYYKLELVNSVLEWREKKYLVPVWWYKLSRKVSKIPNSGRWYRKDYTDWIHHWWDIDAKLWTEVISLDDWIIVRVVEKFDFMDLSKIKRWVNLTYEDKLRNLDILRWNQVWVKTTKWDVVFYSHLNTINSLIKEWQIVQRWSLLWTIWVSWIPDKSYSDYHLHFTVHKNPYDKNKIWANDIVDYMKWDWYFKWESSRYILDNQDNIFEN